MLIQNYPIWGVGVGGLMHLHPSLDSSFPCPLDHWRTGRFLAEYDSAFSDWNFKGGVTAVSFPAAVGPGRVLFLRVAIHHGRTGSHLSLPKLWLLDADGGQNTDCQVLIRRPLGLLSHKLWFVTGMCAVLCFVIALCRNVENATSFADEHTVQ